MPSSRKENISLPFSTLAKQNAAVIGNGVRGSYRKYMENPFLSRIISWLGSFSALRLNTASVHLIDVSAA